MINGVVTSKLTNLQQRLAELRTLYPLTEERLQEWMVLRAVERDLQVAVEIVDRRLSTVDLFGWLATRVIVKGSC